MNGHYHAEFAQDESVILEDDSEFFINEPDFEKFLEQLHAKVAAGMEIETINFQCQFGCGQDHPLVPREGAAIVEKLGPLLTRPLDTICTIK